MPPRGDYESGDAYVLEYGSMMYRFGEDDFEERCDQAARMLGLIPPSVELSSDERADLCDLVVNGEPAECPISELGYHLHTHWRERLEPWDDADDDDSERDDDEPRPRFVSWMRRLLFRAAWVDQRIKEGEVAPRARQDGTFEYVEDREGGRVLEFTDPPDFSDCLYFGEPAE